MFNFGAPYVSCTPYIHILNSVYAEQSACVSALATVIFHQVREVLCSWNIYIQRPCPCLCLHVFHSVIGRIFHHGMQLVEADALSGQLCAGRRHGGLAPLVDGCSSCERRDVDARVLRCADSRCAGQRSSGRVSKHQQTPRQHLEVTD